MFTWGRLEGWDHENKSTTSSRYRRVGSLTCDKRDRAVCLNKRVAGVAAGVAGALIWAAVTVATGYQIGWLAIGIGFLVGAAVRWAGRGTTQAFGVVGGTLAVVSVVAGNFLSMLGLFASALGLSYIEVVTQFDYSQSIAWMIDGFSPIDLLFYGIAIWQGYQVSIREVTQEEIRQRLIAEGVMPEPDRSVV